MSGVGLWRQGRRLLPCEYSCCGLGPQTSACSYGFSSPLGNLTPRQSSKYHPHADSTQVHISSVASPHIQNHVSIADLNLHLEISFTGIWA